MEPSDEEEDEDREQDDSEATRPSDGTKTPKKKSGSSSKAGPKKGDTVSWNWGGGQPSGKVLDVKETE